MITDRPTCPTCHGPYANTRDGYNVHSGTARHRDAVAAAVGRPVTDDDGTEPCGCQAQRHGSMGCMEPGRVHPDAGPQPCLDCAPWQSVGLHGSEMMARVQAGYGSLDHYTNADYAEMNADRELVWDETGGRGFGR